MRTRGTMMAVESVLRALCPTRAEQICSSGHTSITGLKEVKSNHMMKLKDMPLAFILFNPYSKNTNVLQIIYYNLFFLNFIIQK